MSVITCFGITWIPEFIHFYVPTPVYETSEVQNIVDGITWQSNRGDHGIGVIAPPIIDDKHPVELAKEIIHGNFKPGYDARPLVFPMDRADLLDRSPEASLSLASLAVPHLLLRAYELTGDTAFLNSAAEEIRRWAMLERSAILPVGFLWNDHAVAARTGVLIHFLATSRRNSGIDPQIQRDALVFAVRGLRILSKNSHFTFRTNHGVMQNLALLEGASLLNRSSESSSMVDLAIRRLQQQIEFFVGEDGFVREDSVGYHLVGLGLLHTAIDLVKRSGHELPNGWIERESRAGVVAANMLRPDGTLPVFGDTDGAPINQLPAAMNDIGFDQDRPDALCAKVKSLLLPESGVAAFWGTQPTSDKAGCRKHQTVAKWGHWPGHGHQVPDEMAITLWAGNTSWITNLGYWPYGVSGRAFAESWSASNAPHLTDETTADRFRIVNARSGNINDQLILHMSRTGDNGQSIDRQLVVGKAGIWIILDSVSGPGKADLETIWTTSPDVLVTQNSDGRHYVLKSEKSPDWLALSFPRTSEAVLHEGRQGSPLGWTVSGKRPQITKSIVAKPSGNTPAILTVISSQHGIEEAPHVELDEWKDVENWFVTVRSERRSASFRRAGGQMLIDDNGDSGQIELQSLGDPQPLLAADARLLSSALAEYPQWKDILTYRERVTKWLFGFALLTLTCLVVARRVLSKKFELMLARTATAGWMALAYAVTCYLGP